MPNNDTVTGELLPESDVEDFFLFDGESDASVSEAASARGGSRKSGITTQRGWFNWAFFLDLLSFAPNATQQHPWTELKQRSHQRVRRVLVQLDANWAKHRGLREKLAFVLGVTGIWIVAYVMGRYPCAIHHWFGMHALILLSVRCVTYRQQSWHYFLADLCYFVNVLLLLWLYVFPHSRTLYIAVFCLSNGPILWAILAWRNSLVFHSLDKITSLFIHIAPPLTLYTLRWLCCDESCAKQPETLVHSVIQESFLGESLNRFYEFFGWSGGPVPASVDTLPAHTEPLNFIHGTIPTHGDNKLPVLESLMFATAFYSLWQGLYALFIMVFQSKKVEQGKRMTSYSWLLDPAKNAKKEGVMYRLCTIDSLGPGKYQLVLFIFWQFAYALLTIVPTLWMYQSFFVHSFFVGGIACASVWNGANYYMEVFRYKLVADNKKSH